MLKHLTCRVPAYAYFIDRSVSLEMWRIVIHVCIRIIRTFLGRSQDQRAGYNLPLPYPCNHIERGRVAMGCRGVSCVCIHTETRMICRRCLNRAYIHIYTHQFINTSTHQTRFYRFSVLPFQKRKISPGSRSLPRKQSMSVYVTPYPVCLCLCLFVGHGTEWG